MRLVDCPKVGAVVAVTYGHGETQVVVSGVFPVPCGHGDGCQVVEALTLRGNPVVIYEHRTDQ